MKRRAGSRTVLGAALTVTVVLALFPAQTSSFARPSVPSSKVSHPAAVTGQSGVATDSPTATASFTALVSPSATAVVSATATASETDSPTAITSGSAIASPTPSPSSSATATATASASATPSPSVSVTATAAISATDLPTPSDTTVATGSPTPNPAASAYGQVPLQFEPNRGQTDARVAYLAHGPGYTVYLTASEAVLSLDAPAPQPHGAPLFPERLPLSWYAPALPPPAVPITPSPVLHLSLVGANPQAAPMGQTQLPGEVNYLYGTDPSGWLTHLPTFAEVRYPNVYPGIDLVYHGRQQQLEYDFNLQPGADPTLVRLQMSGAQSVALDPNGNLALQAGGATLVQAQPTVYQEINGQRVPVDAHYTLLGGNQVGFNLGSYDRGQPLVIDPVLTYSTYLGGTGDDGATGIAVDSSGAAYLTGFASSTTFPLAGGAPYQGQNGGGDDAFVSKLNPAGSALVYSTYLGGTGTDAGYAIAVDSGGNAYVTGETESPNFPTVNALQAHLAGTENAFVSKLNASGSALLYSTYLGGGTSDYGHGIALDGSGNAYVAGATQSPNFPTVNALQASLSGTEDGFISKLNPTGSALVYSTYLGGNTNSTVEGIAVDGSGAVYVTGPTDSTTFPTVNPLQAHLAGTDNAFISKLTPAGSALVYSTYLGGTVSDGGLGIAVDSGGGAYVTGLSQSPNFPTLNALQARLAGSMNAFVSKLNPAGSALVYSTYLGGNSYDTANGIAVDGSGNAVVTGYTQSPTFPTVNPVQGQLAGAQNAFVSKITPAGSALVYSTYLGGSSSDDASGIALDTSGVAYVAGVAQSPNFPTANPVQGHLAGAENAFVAKLGPTSGAIPWHPRFQAQMAAGLGLGVDLADGHVDLSAADLGLPGRAMSLTLGHTWDSALAMANQGTSAGQGWSTDLTPAMTGSLTATVTYRDATGANWPFLYTGSLGATGVLTSYTSPAGLPWQLSTTTTPGTVAYTLTDVLSGATRTFTPQGQLVADSDSYGNSNTVGYSGGLPTSWSNSGGRSLTLAYSGGLLSDLQSPLWVSSGGAKGQHVTYGYTGNQLTSQTEAAGTSAAQSTHFAYTGTLLTTVTTPLSQSWALGYNPAGQLTSLTSPISGTVGQAGYTPAMTTTFTYGNGTTTVIRGTGTTQALTTTYTLDGAGEPLAMADGLNHTSHATYDADHDLLSHTDPNGNLTINAYLYVGAPGTGGIASTGLITQTIAPAIHPLYPTNALTAPTTNSVYDPTTHDLIERSDNSGAVTYYSYDEHHGLSSTIQLVKQGTGPTPYQWRGQVSCYDQYGEPVKSIDGRGIVIANTATTTTAPPTVPTVATACQGGQAMTYARTMAYDPAGDRQSTSSPAITTTLNGTTSTRPVTTTYGYDGDGNQTSVQSPNGQTTTMAYDHQGRPVSSTLPSVTLYTGSQATPTTSQGYDGDGNLVSQTDANGAVTTTSYDPLGDVVATTNPISGTTIMTYTTTGGSPAYAPAGALFVQDPQGHVTSSTYDGAGRLSTRTDGAGEQTSYLYDANGNPTTITSGSSGTTLSTDTRTYDALNERATDAVSGPNTPAQTTTSSYDLEGRQVRQQDPNSDVTFNSFDLAGDLVAREMDSGGGTLPAGTNPETFSYDSTGNQIGHLDAAGRAQQTLLDGAGRTTQTVNSFAGTTSLTTTISYDPDGNVLSQLATIGTQTHVVTGTVNAADWVVSGSDDGLATSYGYDAAGRQRQVTVANGATMFTTQLDSQGRATQIAEGTGQYPVSFTYNADNLVTQASFPGGVTIGRQYDGANRLTQATINAPGSGVTTTYQYAYDPTGWLNQISSTVGQVSGPPTATPTPAPGSLVGSAVLPPSRINLTTEGTSDWADWGFTAPGSFDHKANVGSQIPTFSNLNGGTVSQSTLPVIFSWSDGTPDAASTGTSTAASLKGNGSGFGLTLPADPTSRTVHLYVAVSSGQANLTAALSDGSAPPYSDSNLASFFGNRVQEYTLVYQAGVPNQSLHIAFTLLNNYGAGAISLAAASLIGGTAGPTTTTTTLTHDGLGHLTGASDGVDPTVTWSYDGQGNLVSEATGGTTSSTYTYATSGNTVNELTSLAVSGQATRYYAYDKYGNPLSIGPSPTNPCPSSTSTCLGYDAQARLSSVVEANNGPTIAMTYNALGLRAGYTVTPYGAGQPSLNEQFTYRGGQLAQTVTISGTTTYTDTYVYSQHGMPLELLRTTNGVLNRYWYERDGLGNVVALTDSNGTVVDQYAYDLWGKPTLVQESVPQQLRYQGYWYDNELGWYWLTTRVYDPTLKRFLQPDPSEMDGLFSYVYVGDDPVDGSDPSGFGVGGHGNCGPDGIYCGAIEQEVAPTDPSDPCYHNVDLCAPEGHVTSTQIVGGAVVTTGYVPAAQVPTSIAPSGPYNVAVVSSTTQYSANQFSQVVAATSSTAQVSAAGNGGQDFDRVEGPWGTSSLLIKQVGDGRVQLTASLFPSTGVLRTVDWEIGVKNRTTGDYEFWTNTHVDLPLVGRLVWPDIPNAPVWTKTISPVGIGRGSVVAVFSFTATLSFGLTSFPVTVGGDESTDPLPTVALNVS